MDGPPLDYRQLEQELESGLTSLEAGTYGDRETLLTALLGAAAAAGDRPRLRAALKLARDGGISPEAAREGVLQTYLFAGYPRAINALADVTALYGPPEDATVDLDPHPGDEPRWLAEGQALCRKVYGEAYPKLLDTMARVAPELGRWMVVEGYGKVLSRPGLSPRLRELAAVGALAALAVPPQLRAHLRGALLVGATPAEVAGAIEAAALVVPEERDRARRLLQTLLDAG
jgi:4-carboxymuconolactone decarboxylase